MTKVPTLIAEIRGIVDRAERRLAQPEIRSQLKRETTSNSFCVTIAQMLKAKQLSRRKITQAVRALNPNAQFVYGPGRVPVEDALGLAPRKKTVGFMEAKRIRAAKARARRRAK